VAEPRADAEPDVQPGVPDPTPEEAARLLASARRAREDAAAGRVYRVDEAFLQRLGDAAEAAGRPLTRVEVIAFADAALERGEIERAPVDVAGAAPADATPGAGA
jgi:hypothetical protein